MWKASVARSLAYSCCVTNGDCFCFHLPLCPSCDVTWACSSQRTPELRSVAGCGLSSLRLPPGQSCRCRVVVSVPRLTALPEGPSPLLASCSSLAHIQGSGHTQGAVCLSCPLRPPVFVCPLPPSRPAFAPHTWLPDHPRAACLSHAGRHPQSRCPRTQRLLGTHDSFCSVSITCIVYLLASHQRFMLFRVQCGFHELSASKAVLPLGLLYLQTPCSLCVE